MRLTVKEMAVFGMLAGLMFASKQIMEVLPNVHLLGVFTIAITLVYRRKALYPIYGFVLIQGLFSGFALWWIALPLPVDRPVGGGDAPAAPGPGPGEAPSR